MENIKCTSCGFYEKNADESAKCFIKNIELTTDEQPSCLNFYPIQYDGKAPYSPKEHMFMYNSLKSSQQMTSKQGLKF